MSEDLIRMLERIDRRLDAIESRLDEVAAKDFNLEGALAIATNTFDDFTGASPEKRRDLEKKVAKALDLLAKIVDSNIVGVLDTAVKHLPQIENAIEALVKLPDLASIAVDTFDGVIADEKRMGIDIHELNQNIITLSGQVVRLLESGALNQLLDSGVFDPTAIETVGKLGRSLAGGVKTTRKVNLFTLMIALNNKDFKHAICFVMDFAKQFGRQLQVHKADDNREAKP